jgi:hypothetical protein
MKTIKDIKIGREWDQETEYPYSDERKYWIRQGALHERKRKETMRWFRFTFFVVLGAFLGCTLAILFVWWLSILK